MSKLVYNELFEWDGWGGEFRLVSGKCRLRIYDLRSDGASGPTPLKPMVVVVSDLSEKYGVPGVMTVRSCAAQIATNVAEQFSISPQRLQYIEYYPERRYGKNNEHLIGEKFDRVDFDWRGRTARNPRWEALDDPHKAIMAQLIKGDATQ